MRYAYKVQLRFSVSALVILHLVVSISCLKFACKRNSNKLISKANSLDTYQNIVDICTIYRIIMIMGQNLP